MQFEFYEPNWLYLLSLLPLLVFLRGRSGSSQTILFSSAALLGSQKRRFRNHPGWPLIWLSLLAFVALVTALARPQKIHQNSEIKYKALDIALILDVSGSMKAATSSVDPKTRKRRDRIGVAKASASEFVKKRPHDRIGLVLFDTNTYLISPLTLNHKWLQHNLESIEIGKIIGGGGTGIGLGMATAVKHMRAIEGKESRIAILLTDGQDNASGSTQPLLVAEAAKVLNIKFYTIGTGSADKDLLKKIAKLTGGKFYAANNQKELDMVYDDIDKLEKTERFLNQNFQREELFAYPTLLAFGLLMLSQILTHTRYRRLP